MDNAPETPQDHVDGHYPAELMRWMETEGQENHHADRIKHNPITRNQLKLERSCLCIASKNIREELEDTIRAIIAQESELMRQPEEKMEKSGAEDAPEVEEEFAIFANGQVGTYRQHYEAVMVPKERTGIGQRRCSQAPLNAMLMGCSDDTDPRAQRQYTGDDQPLPNPGGWGNVSSRACRNSRAT